MHGITSLTTRQANPADILAGNRGHWGVENREHYVRDRTFDEDRSQVRTGASPQFLATARNIVMSLLRLAGCENVARGMEYLSRRLDQILALLGVLPEPIRKGDAYTTTLPMTLRCSVQRRTVRPALRPVVGVRQTATHRALVVRVGRPLRGDLVGEVTAVCLVAPNHDLKQCLTCAGCLYRTKCLICKELFIILGKAAGESHICLVARQDSNVGVPPKPVRVMSVSGG